MAVAQEHQYESISVRLGLDARPTDPLPSGWQGVGTALRVRPRKLTNSQTTRTGPPALGWEGNAKTVAKLEGRKDMPD